MTFVKVISCGIWCLGGHEKYIFGFQFNGSNYLLELNIQNFVWRLIINISTDCVQDTAWKHGALLWYMSNEFNTDMFCT